MTLLKKDSQMARRSFDILHVQNGAQCFATLYYDLQSVVCGAFLGLIELNGQKDLLLEGKKAASQQTIGQNLRLLCH